MSEDFSTKSLYASERSQKQRGAKLGLLTPCANPACVAQHLALGLWAYSYVLPHKLEQSESHLKPHDVCLSTVGFSVRALVH